ncbi:tRNA (guanine(6)-N2)-methyltransferase THUMP3-like [Bacillus rossius redtenbacheri]|uniref:tRNA (guanine(6)-N2)-methyltransferase THUMP3-like n=1 Tax=Bacillus rossius redtenbacheri TaxID=93214 RepID=UPI002FDE3C36
MLQHVDVMDVFRLLELSSLDATKVTFEATVPTGFETVALGEFRDKFGSTEEACHSRGRIFFNVPNHQLSLVQELRSVDNIFVLAYGDVQLKYQNRVPEDYELIKNHASITSWDKALSVWRNVYEFSGILFPTKEEYCNGLEQEQHLKELTKIIISNELHDKSLFKEFNYDELVEIKNSFLRKREEEIVRESFKDKCNSSTEIAFKKTMEQAIRNQLDKREMKDKVLKYRVTCYRSGRHSFGSQDAAYHFGGVLQDKFNWIVDLSVHDLEVVLTVKDDVLYCGIALTKESKHHRNIAHFGPTTLRATICYNLLRLGAPAVGDVIIDPLCGGGSISIEGCIAFPGTYHLCGDVHLKATSRTSKNIKDLRNKESFIELLMWDAKALPLLDSCVDLFVTDLPFGKRSGSRHDNRTLYRDVLVELGRVVRPSSGRAVLLTQDRNSMSVAFSQTCGLWTITKIMRANIGGLDAAVYVLRREPSVYYRDILFSRKKKKRKIKNKNC